MYISPPLSRMLEVPNHQDIDILSKSCTNLSDNPHISSAIFNTTTMPYHPDSATRDLFIRDHIHTPTTLSQVACSICRQRCTHRHPAVQISGHSQCQCVFGKTCLLQWLESGSAASNTCPSCKAVLYNANGDDLDGEVDEGTESDNNDGGEDELTIPTRG